MVTFCLCCWAKAGIKNSIHHIEIVNRRLVVNMQGSFLLNWLILSNGARSVIVIRSFVLRVVGILRFVPFSCYYFMQLYYAFIFFTPSYYSLFKGIYIGLLVCFKNGST